MQVIIVIKTPIYLDMAIDLIFVLFLKKSITLVEMIKIAYCKVYIVTYSN